MAKLVVNITSKDVVQPISRTPNHLKFLQFSFRDQVSPPLYMPNIFYYHRNCQISDSETSILLKKSLSETLVQFYPLAGRIQGNSSIECNDEGLLFCQASVLATLAQVIQNPYNSDDLLRLLPFPPYSSTNKRIVAGVQVNLFSCGGMAISVCISHKVCDAFTSAVFVNTWANKARRISSNSDGDSDSVSQGRFVSTTFFPGMNLDGIFDPEHDVCKEKIVTRRLIFDKETIDTLKKQCADDVLLHEKPPSKVEAVSAFIWKQFIKAARAKRTPPKIFGAAQIVNLRTVKSSPIIPKSLYGNIYWNTFAHALTDVEMKYSEAVDKLRNSVKLMDRSHIEKMKSGDCVIELKKAFEKLSPKGGGDHCALSDASKFPYYEVNFGWGKPTWVSMTTLPFRNAVFLMGTKCGEGIEAWVNVLEQDAAMLEQDHEFVSLASHASIRAKM